MIENARLEFKREYSDDIRKTVIAFANTDGGVIRIGISDDGTAFGIKDTDGDMTRLTNMLRDCVKPDVTMFVSYEVERVDEKNILKVTVQKGTSSPYYIAGKGIRPEGVYVRQGASSVPATESAIIRMIKETDGEKYEDVRSRNQELTFVEAEKEFAKRGVPFGEAQQKSLKIISTNGVYTNLGLILSDQCPHTVKIAVFEGLEKSVFKDRREFDGSLIKQLNDVYEYIEIYNRTKAEISGLHRIDSRDYPTEAIREALLNSLVHRDYAYSASTLISIFDNRIEFVSIGGLVKGMSYDDIMLGISITRNINLANIFYRLKLIEAYGTGIANIFRSYTNSTVKPEIEVSDNAFKITLPNVNTTINKHELPTTQKIVIDLFKNQPSIIRKDVEAALGVSQTFANRILREMIEENLIETSGQGKNTKYILKLQE